MPVNDISDLEPQLANCRDYWLGWGAADRLDGDLTYYRSGLVHSQLNGVLRLQSGRQVSDAIEQAAGGLAGVPWRWWVGPDSAPGVADALVSHGAVKLRATPIMAVRLDRLVPVEGPGSLKIEVVDTTDGPAEWVRTYSSSFGVTPEQIDDVVRLETERPDNSRIVRVLGRLFNRDLHPFDTTRELVPSRSVVRRDRCSCVLPHIATIICGKDHPGKNSFQPQSFFIGNKNPV